jgi:hypothetical protein
MSSFGAHRASRRPELELFIHVARTRIDDAGARRLIELVQQDLDWQYTSRLARWHGILPLLYWHLESICPHAVPVEVRQKLRSHVRDWARSSLFRTSELLRILSRFEDHGVEVVPYKGPFLAASLYRNLALRPYGDLDLFIRRSDFQAAKELLVSLDYEPNYRLTARQEAVVLRSRRVYDMCHRHRGTTLELHWSIVPEYFSSTYEGEDLWARLIPMTLAGRTFRMFSPEDRLLILCLHGAKHLWSRMIWICDIAELIRARPEMSWTMTLERARAIGCERMVFLGIYLARELLGAPVPHDIIQQIQTERAVANLAEKVYGRMENDVLAVPGGWESSLFYLRVREKLGRKAADMLRVMLVTNPEDWAQFPIWLPSWLTRPFRLLKRYGFRALRRPSPSPESRAVPDSPIASGSDHIE